LTSRQEGSWPSASAIATGKPINSSTVLLSRAPPERIRIAIPISALTAAAAKVELRSPMLGMSAKPASHAPATAPNVFAPYAYPAPRPTFVIPSTTPRVTSGNVMPISTVGSSMTAEQRPICATK
jgi:hypothetical protein